MKRQTLTLRITAAILFLLLLAATLFSQSANDLMGQAQKAYNDKEYAKSAELYMQAYKADAKQLLALYNGACSYALAGDKEKALSVLEQLADKGFNNLDLLKDDADFASVKDDARFAKVVAKVGENAKKNPPPARWKAPYTVLDAPTEPGDLASRIPAGEKGTAWLDGKVLTFLCHSNAPSVRLGIGIQGPMKKIPNSDLWIWQGEMEGWDKAFVSYGFLEEAPDVQASYGLLKLWKGSHAPEMPQKAATLKGKIERRTIHSDALGEDRKIVVYLPPDAPKKDLPAVFLCDGGSCPGFAAVLEPLILAHKVKPCAIVGIESGEYTGDRSKGYDPSKDMRALEYVPGMDPDRFNKHAKFFTDEVSAYVAKEFGVSTKRKDLAVTGFSNGGAFAAAIAVKRPEFFGTSMPLSLGIPPTDPKPTSPMPRMFFAGGSLESFGLSTKREYELVKTWGVECSFEMYAAGHDQAMWELAFSKLMPKCFPG